MPDSTAVDELAQWCKTLFKRGVTHPWPYQVRIDTGTEPEGFHTAHLQAIWKYCPHYAVHGTLLAKEAAEGADAAAVSKDKEEKLTLLQWDTAFDMLAVAAACIPVDGARGKPMWEYQAAVAHRRVVHEVWHFLILLCMRPVFGLLQVACGAEHSKPQRRAWLAIIYDKLARKQWSERAKANEVPQHLCACACVS